jgi:arylsulfatase A-like enzyme
MHNKRVLSPSSGDIERTRVNRHRTSRREFLKLLGVAAASLLLPSMDCGAAPAALTLSATKQAFATPNIILAIVDALRADHVSANGYAQATTPNLDSWIADEGVSFTNATTPSAWTYPAGAAMMTGQSPFNLNASWDNTTLPTDITTLAEHLHAAGYYTAGFVSNAFLGQSRGFGRGFDVFDDSVAAQPTSYQGVAGAINALALNWLDTWVQGTPSQPLFLFLYYVDPHTWYHPLPPYDTMYDPTYTGTLTPDVYRDGQDVVSGAIVPTQRDVEHLVALYDGETSYWDAHLGNLLTALQGEQLLDDALIVMTADHGQAFGEHGKWTHGNCVYEEVLRVPLLMRYTGTISPGTIVTEPVQNMDLMPSILDWVGIPIPSDLQAVSLRSLAEGLASPASRDVFSELDGVNDPAHWAHWNAPRHSLRSLQRDGWKYIHHLDDPDADELYHLNASSVYETDNLIDGEPARAQEMRQAVLDWFGIPPYRVYAPYITR